MFICDRKYLHKNPINFTKKPINFTKKDLIYYAAKGDINILIRCLNYLFGNKYSETTTDSVVFEFIYSAIISNNLILIEFFINNNLYLDDIAKYAAKYNNLQIINLLHKNNFKFNKDIGFIAAGSGSKKILEYLKTFS